MESEPSRYCLKCGYALVVATDNRCPECGQVFHPDHPITFAVKSPAPRLKQGAISFTWAIAYSSLSAIIAFLIPESLFNGRDDLIAIAFLVVLYLSVTAYAFRSPSLISLLGVAIGVSWGFLITLGVAISFQNQRVSVIWFEFSLALVVLPVMAILLALPIWLFRHRHMEKRRNRILAEYSPHK